MNENWIDYYEILGVSPDSNDKEIKDAYRYKVSIHHPDRLMGSPESIRHRAEEDLKKINQAYKVLGNLQKRQKYHSEWVRQRAKSKFIPKPKPIVDPSYIQFSNVEPGEIKSASFIIRNLGGPYSKIWFSNPDSLVRVVRWTSLTTSDELPLKVEIETEGKDWGKSYSEHIEVKLDEEKTQVKVELQTKPEPVRKKVPVSGIPKTRQTPSPPSPPVSPRRGFPTWGKWVMGIVCIVALIIGGIAIFGEEEVAGITNFQVVSRNGYLTVSFNLVDAENKPITADGEAYLRLYDGEGSVFYYEKRLFSENEFNKHSKEYFWRISQWALETERKRMIPEGELTMEHIREGIAHLYIKVNREDTNLLSVTIPVIFYSVDEAMEIILSRWFEEHHPCRISLGPSTFHIYDYSFVGEHVWVVGLIRGVDIILYSSDGGNTWEIQWRAGLFFNPLEIEFLDKKEGWVAAHNTILHTSDGGKTWKSIWRSGWRWEDHLEEFQVIDRQHLRGRLKDRRVLYTFDGGNTWKIQSE